MKTACLVASIIPVAFGLFVTPATAGPFARAAMREATRLAGSPAQPVDSTWARVRTLSSGTDVSVSAKGAQAARRYVVQADESSLTVLNLTAVGLQVTAARALLDIATRHPEVLLAVQAGRTVEQKDVRVSPDGVFVAGRKVADLGQVVERIARGDVVELKIVRAGGWGSAKGAAMWAGAGFLAGSFTFLAIEFSHCPTIDGGCHGAWGPLAGLALVGLPVAGGLWGYRHGPNKTVEEEIIYHAP